MQAYLKNGLKTYYEIHGDTNQPYVVMINGLKCDHTGWLPLIDALQEDYCVVLFDNRAIGLTKDDGQPFSIATLAEDVQQLMDYLHIDKAFVVGHSMGAAIALCMADQFSERVKKCFLVNGFLKLNPESTAAFARLIDMYQSGATPAEIMDYVIPWVFSKAFITPAIWQLIMDTSEADPNPQSAEDYIRQYNALVNFDATPFLDQIKVPTIVIGSKQDVTATMEESQALAAMIPHAQLLSLPGAHASAVEDTVLLADHLKKYLV